MTNPISRWLDDDRQPRDLYELLGRPRFDGDTAGLLTALKGANRELLPYQNHRRPEMARRAMELLKLVGRAEDVLSDAAKRETYDQALARALAQDFDAMQRSATGAGGEQALAAWLLREQNVNPESLPAVLQRIRQGRRAAGAAIDGSPGRRNGLQVFGSAERPASAPASRRDSPPPDDEPLEAPAGSLWDDLDEVPLAGSVQAPGQAPLPRRTSFGRLKGKSRAERLSRTAPGGGDYTRSLSLIFGGGLVLLLIVGFLGYVNDVGPRWSATAKRKPRAPGKSGDRFGGGRAVLPKAKPIDGPMSFYLNCEDRPKDLPSLVLRPEPQPEPTGPLFLPQLDQNYRITWSGMAVKNVTAKEMGILLKLKARPTEAERLRGGTVSLRVEMGSVEIGKFPINIPADAFDGDGETNLDVSAAWKVGPLNVVPASYLVIRLASPNRGVFAVYGYGMSKLEFRPEPTDPGPSPKVSRARPRFGEVILSPPTGLADAVPAQANARTNPPSATRTDGPRAAPPQVSAGPGKRQRPLPGKASRNRTAEKAVDKAKPAPKEADVDRLLRLGQSLEQQEKYAGALDYYRQVVDRHPNTPQAKTAAARIKVLRERN